MNIILPILKMENRGSEWLSDLLSGSASKYPSFLILETRIIIVLPYRAK